MRRGGCVGDFYRKFAERQTHDANIQYFILKRITQIRKMRLNERMNVHCMHRPIYSKNSFFRWFIHLRLKFCCWGLLPKLTLGLSLDPAWVRGICRKTDTWRQHTVFYFKSHHDERMNVHCMHRPIIIIIIM